MAVNGRISTLPDAGQRGVDARDDFVSKRETYDDHLSGTHRDEMNTIAGEIDATATEINTAEANTITAKNEAILAKDQAQSASSTAEGAQEDIATNYATYVSGTTYSIDAVDTRVEASRPYSGSVRYHERADAFYFETSENFINKMAFKEAIVKMGAREYRTTTEETITDFDTVQVGWTENQDGSYDATNAYSYIRNEDVLNSDNFRYEITYKFTVSNISAGYIKPYLPAVESSSSTPQINANGDYEYSFDGARIGTEGNIGLAGFGFTGTVSNIEIKIKKTHLAIFTPSETYVQYQATNGLNLTHSVNKGDTVVVDRTVGQVEEVFRCIQDAPNGTALTNTDYFIVADDEPIAPQHIAYHRVNESTNAYSVATEPLIYKMILGEMQKAVMTKNGFDYVSEGLYSKDGYLVSPIGIWQGLNKGAYHPIYNVKGSMRFAVHDGDNLCDGGANWNIAQTTYSQTTPPSEVADCFGEILASTGVAMSDDKVYRYTSGTISNGITENPQGKFNDIIYPDQWIDLREYARVLTPDERARKKADDLEWGVTCGVKTYEFLNFTFNEQLNNGDTQLYGFPSNLIYTSILDGYSNQDRLEKTNQLVILGDDGTAYEGRWGIDASFSGDVLIDGDVRANFTSGTARLIMKPEDTTTLSTSSKLSVDVIGNPDNYPQSWKDRLAEGKPMFWNALLVGQDGTDYTDGNETVIYSDKALEMFTNIYTDNEGSTYGTSIKTLNSIGNYNEEVYVVGGTNIYIAPYTSKNIPLVETNPLPIISTVDKVVASNSHSLYKGALIGNSIGKIQTGNGTNGYESKVLENVELTPYNYTSHDVIGTAPIGTIVLKVQGGGTAGADGNLYKRLTASVSGDLSLQGYDNTTYWEDIGTLESNLGDYSFVYTTPTHSTISLDNSNSTASKWFESEAEKDGYLVPMYFIKELAYNSVTSSYDGDNEEFDQLINGTDTDLNGNTIITKVMHGQPLGRVK